MRFAKVVGLLTCRALWFAHAELLNVFVLQRHGNRAPNPSVQKICPSVAGTSSDDIYRDFHALPGQLTPPGKDTMRSTGRFFHDHYFGGEDPKMKLPVEQGHKDRAKYFTFGATDKQRHYESVALVAGEFFPGSKPPDVVIDEAPDNFLKCPPQACVEANHKDVSEWLASVGKNLFSSREPVVREIEKMCGHNFTDSDIDFNAANPHPSFQDVADLLTFRSESNLPMPPHIHSVLDRARAIETLGIRQRLLGTDEQVVYWMGDLPQRLLDIFSNTEKHFGVYVTSREKLYAAEDYWGFVFNSGGILPTFDMYPGTSLIFELHRQEDGSKSVQVGSYYPAGHPAADSPHKATLKWLELPGCDSLRCPFDTFAELTRERSKVDGKDFRQICSARVAKPATLARTGGSVVTLLSLISVAAVFALAMLTFVALRSHRSRDYVRLLG